MGLIPQDIIDQILDRNDIVEVISSYIPLKRAGRNFKANCPFHHEKTPSFVVSLDKQIYHCFGCSVGGNVVDFVMRQERVDFPEAARILASRANIIIPVSSTANPEATSLKEMVYKTNETAAAFFHEALIHPTAEIGHVVRYLKDRSVTADIVKKFKIGFAHDKWDSLMNHLRSKNISLNVMEKAGLIVPRETQEGFYDRFRDRITFPIFDVKGRGIGFGARTMKDGSAKYINSPETVVYTKGHHLYGFNITKEAVRERDFVIVVEGYMDFIIPYQAGAENIVASLGTALTVEQIRLLKRYTQNVVMLFDADAAGENAMVRSLDLLIEEGMNVKVASLAAGEDPDSYVRKFGAEEFHKRVQESLSLFDYKMKVLTGKYSHKTVEGKTKISHEMLLTINRFPNAVMKYGYIKQLASMLSIQEEALLLELQKMGKTASRESNRADSTTTVAAMVKNTANNAERSLLKLIFDDEAFISVIKEDLSLSDFQDDAVKDILSHVFSLREEGKEVKVRMLMNHFESEAVHQLISTLATEEDVPSDKEKIYRDCVNRIKSNRMKQMRQGLLVSIKEAETSGNENQLEELKQQFNQLIKG